MLLVEDIMDVVINASEFELAKSSAQDGASYQIFHRKRKPFMGGNLAAHYS